MKGAIWLFFFCHMTSILHFRDLNFAILRTNSLNWCGLIRIKYGNSEILSMFFMHSCNRQERCYSSNRIVQAVCYAPVYWSILLRSISVLTCAESLKRVLSEEFGDEVLSFSRKGILFFWPHNLIWEHTHTHTKYFKCIFYIFPS